MKFPHDIYDLKCHGRQRSSVFLWRDRDFSFSIFKAQDYFFL